MSWTAFRTHFEGNAGRPLPDTEGPHGVAEAVRAEVARSLARFQIGEAGEGRIAHDIDRFSSPGIDDDYRAALKLFVREEGRHGAILARLVRALGGSVLSSTWTERLFVFGRRLLGIRLKLVVLLAAEVIGAGFYRMIAERLDDGTVKRALFHICADEEEHLRFHREFFAREAPSGLSRASWLATWALVGGSACAVVLVDHRRTLAALGVPLPHAARRLFALCGEAARSPVARTREVAV